LTANQATAVLRKGAAPERSRSNSQHASRDIVIIATAFNLLFEYSLRGVNHLAEKPLFPIFLIAAYASLFAMEEDLIRRFRLKDYHLVVLAFTYGAVYQCLVSGAAFINPGFLGVDWPRTLFVLLIWWGGIQSVLTFYLANRIRPRDWQAPLLGRKGWSVALAINLGNIGLFQLSGKIPHGEPIGYAAMLVVFVIAALTFSGFLNGEREPEPLRRHRFIDLLLAVTVVVFAVCALFLTGDPTKSGGSEINRLASHIVVAWTIVTVIAATAYRWKMKCPIPV
jgi:hypothetical protein